MKAILVTCLLFGVIATVFCSYANNQVVNNNYNNVPLNSAGYVLNNPANYGRNYGSCKPLGTPAQNIADCCSQSSAPIDRSNLNKCCLAQGQFCNGHQDKCCYANGQMDCVPTGNQYMGVRTCQRRVTPSNSGYSA